MLRFSCRREEGSLSTRGRISEDKHGEEESTPDRSPQRVPCLLGGGWRSTAEDGFGVAGLNWFLQTCGSETVFGRQRSRMGAVGRGQISPDGGARYSGRVSGQERAPAARICDLQMSDSVSERDTHRGLRREPGMKQSGNTGTLVFDMERDHIKGVFYLIGILFRRETIVCVRNAKENII